MTMSLVMSAVATMDQRGENGGDVVSVRLPLEGVLFLLPTSMLLCVASSLSVRIPRQQLCPSSLSSPLCLALLLCCLLSPPEATPPHFLSSYLFSFNPYHLTYIPSTSPCQFLASCFFVASSSSSLSVSALFSSPSHSKTRSVSPPFFFQSLSLFLPSPLFVLFPALRTAFVPSELCSALISSLSVASLTGQSLLFSPALCE